MAEADPWLRILLRCQVTHAPLDDPAKGTRCAHQAVCNFKNLCHRKKCPIAGCAAVWYPHRVTRDEALKAIIERAPPGTQVVWIHSETSECTFQAPASTERDVIDVAGAEDRLASAPAEVKSEEDGQADACCICLDDDGSMQDKGLIVFCGDCNLGFHEECYGIRGKIPDGDWLCEACDISPGVVPRCVACPEQNGGLKRTADGKGFAHCICVAHIPELFYSENSERGKPTVFGAVAGFDRVNEARRKYRCGLCSDPLKADQGIKVICGYKSCMNAFHPMCAFRAGLEEHEQKIQEGRPVYAFHCKEDKHDRKVKKVRRVPVQAGASLRITQLSDKRLIDFGWAALEP